MAYAVKEIFYTLQGEGMNAGRAAVFCRFSGCNLWSGREQDREQAVCQFCDTDFFGTDGDGGGKFASAEELANAVAEKWPKNAGGQRFVVCTGGEPLLQLDAALIAALHERGFWIAVETNGTIAVPEGVDWVCVSPKANARLVVTRGDELKVVYPQETDPNEYLKLGFKHFFIQPMDGPDSKASLAAAIDFCQQNPVWRLSLQTHKMIGIR
ncbi:MAG TPA: 7-carboxy-7-deazaguanine synthase [Acidobacteriaceae bacterium]|nr:7-carboxy-7-deazaguanine synthase [Acidobacteriaceae bacterium]